MNLMTTAVRKHKLAYDFRSSSAKRDSAVAEGELFVDVIWSSALSSNEFHLVGNTLTWLSSEWKIKQKHRTYIEEKFYKLTEQWYKQTKYISKSSKKYAHPSYLKIIGMGERAIPYILRDLEDTRKDWFGALAAITDHVPSIPESDFGNVDKMAEAWLEWGKSAGYDV